MRHFFVRGLPLLAILVLFSHGALAALATPQLVSPADGATGQSKTLRLDWNAVTGANLYRVFISTSQATVDALADNAMSCSGCIDDGAITSSVSYYDVPAGKLSAGTTYYWRVHAGNSVNQTGGPNSDVWWFKTGQISNVQPSGGTFNIGSLMTVTWSYGSESSSTLLLISIKRDSCVVQGVDTCTKGDDNWQGLATGTANDGTEQVIIPTAINPATDWRVFVADATNGSYTPAAGTITVEDSRNSPPCIGNNYEQPVPLPQGQSPTIDNVNKPLSVNEGGQATLGAEATVDTGRGGYSFFYWCTDRGGFRYDPNAPDYSSVIFNAPRIAEGNQEATIILKVGDTLGHVTRATFTITIREIDNNNLRDPAPTVSITQPGTLKVGEPYTISFQLGDLNSKGQDASQLLTTDLYSLIGGQESAIIKGLKGKISSYVWVPPVVLSEYSLKVVTTDDNSSAMATTSNFSVDPFYGVEGYTTDLYGAALENVKVEAEGSGVAYSESSGYYKIVGLTNTTYLIRASKANYLFQPSSVSRALSADDSLVQIHFTGSPDSDADGIVDGADICPSTPPYEVANGQGCSCSQIQVAFRDCPADACNGENWLDYPEDGSDACANGVVTEHSCAILGSMYSAACDPDDDNDGVLDTVDACPLDPNDPVGDPCNHDEDGDGVLDTVDSFPFDPNESQDSDGDGIGDNADLCPLTPNDAVGDPCAVNDNNPGTGTLVLEDGGDGTTSRWVIHDNDPPASIRNEYDDEGHGRVIVFSGDGYNNLYRMGNQWADTWSLATHDILQWEMSFVERVTVYVKVSMENGNEGYLMYDSTIPVGRAPRVEAPFVYLPLGIELDGNWYTVTRDLQADINLMWPGVSVRALQYILVRGSGKVDNVRLLDASQTSTLSGRVIGPDGAPLEGVTVGLPELAKTATTDSDGRYQIALIPVGNYTVTFAKEGYEFVLAGETITFDGTDLVRDRQGNLGPWVLEDAEDGSPSRWVVHNIGSQTATISNLNEDAAHGRVMVFSGNGYQDLYRMGNQWADTWSLATHDILQWEMSFAERVTVYVKVSVEGGNEGYLIYDSTITAGRAPRVEAPFVYLPLGIELDGNWYTVTRDLQADIALMWPGVSVRALQYILVRGSGKVDNISLIF